MITSPPVTELYALCTDAFTARVRQVGTRWGAPTPLPGWDVRSLVGHVVAEERWAPPLLAGATLEEIGDRFDGDLLGDDPAAAYSDAAAAALAAVVADGAMGRIVHLSFGDVPAAEYAMQLAADHLVHAWDLARALGADPTLDPAAVRPVLAWFGCGAEDAYRAAGVIGARVPVPAGADAQAELLARFGRSQ